MKSMGCGMSLPPHVRVFTEERHEVAMNIDPYFGCLLWNVRRFAGL